MPTPVRDARPDHGGAGPAVGAIVAIVLVGFVVPVAIAAHYHALGIPRSDDWSYLVTEFRWTSGGRLSFNHWVSMSLVGQLVVAAPLAMLLPRDISALQCLTAGAGVIGLGAVWIAARRIDIGRAAALLLVLTIAVSPLWGPLAVSFMTDVPAFAASAVAIACAVVGIRRAPVHLGWIVSAIAAAVFACTIRQYAVVTLGAVVVAAWCAAGSDRRARRSIVAAAVLAVLAIAVFLLWWRTVPDGRGLTPSAPDVHALSVFVSKGAGFLRLSGLMLLPVLVAAHPIARVRAAWRAQPAVTVLVSGASAMWLAVASARAAADLFVGNYVVHDGALSDIVIRGPRRDVLPQAVWLAVVAAASLAGVVLAVLAAHGAGNAVRAWLAPGPTRPDPVTVLLTISVVGYLGGYAVAILTGIQVYDRYLLPVIPAVGMLLLRAPVPVPAGAPAGRGRTSHSVATVVALVVLAGVGFAFATDSASFDGARWRAAQAAVAHGWPARRVAGGFEWRAYKRGDRYRTPGVHPPDCVAVKIEPKVAPDRIVAVVRSTAPTRATTRFVAYRTTADCPVPVRRGATAAPAP